jgi:alanyl-tRNA synthetase
MLGNFSFGDYFKREAIEYGWGFVTGVLGLEPDDLVVSVHYEDEETFDLWREIAGLEERRIFRLPDSENFWQMGDSGPCGPCTEIHQIVDRDIFEAGGDPAGEGYTEFYNLVFMQFEQSADGERVPLPKPCVDTGLGLERTARMLQGVQSNYDTDLFQPLIRQMAERSGKRYGDRKETDVSLQVVADHARACAFLIGDGVLPSNVGRGYVLRRVLRRAARHGVLLGVNEPFLHEISATVIEEMGDAYPDLATRRSFILDTIQKEEERFVRTLGRGLALLDEEIALARRDGRDRLEGAVVFKLYDTFGFPTDLTEDILRGRELDYDRGGFDACMLEQSERAREAWKGSGQTTPSDVYNEIATRGDTRFTGYENLVGESEIRALLRDGSEVERVSEGESVELLVAESPFYGESGGQVGDTGVIVAANGRLRVEDTQKPLAGLIVHRGTVELGSLARGDQVTLEVDAAKRAATVRNHSGTHLFHWALRQVLGDQVMQKGSLVAPERLRFDFTHDEPLTDDEILRVEDLVNQLILANEPGRTAEKSYQEALDDGAIAIFEEKYGDVVRVVGFGPSVELCGGTHARSTGDIGSFRIVSQSAIGAGVRRVEAQTGLGVLGHARAESRLLRDAARLLRAAPADLPERVARLLERQRELERELEQTRANLRRGGADDPMQQVSERGGVKVLASEVSGASPKELRGMVDELKQRLGSGVVLLVARQDDKVALALGVTKDLVGRFKAGELIKPVAEAVGGSGGGRPDFAQAGGPEVGRVQQAIECFQGLIDAG